MGVIVWSMLKFLGLMTDLSKNSNAFWFLWVQSVNYFRSIVVKLSPLSNDWMSGKIDASYPMRVSAWVLLIVSVLISSCGLYQVPEEDSIEVNIQHILAGMNLEQKVGQMVQAEIKHATPDDVKNYYLGSVLNGGGTFPNERKDSTIDDWLQLADQYYLASMDTSAGGAGIPIIWGTDAVHGHNNVMGATLFPHNIGLGAANDPKLVQKIGEITAREVAVTGIDWLFAPTVAVVKDYRWGRAYEGYSTEPEIVRAYAGEIVRGIQGNLEELRDNPQKLIATAKHFIGDGGTHRGIDQGDTRLDLPQLLDLHGQGYITALDANVQTVMASFNSWNGEKVHGNKHLLTDVLKDQLGFDGIVISDWNGIGQVDGCSNESCAQAINAGIDMIMVPEDWKLLISNTIVQVKTGQIPLSRIDDAVTRILRVKMRAGMFEKGAPSTRQSAGDKTLIGSANHRAVAREAVRKSLVLLKNNRQILPLNPSQHILVTGDGAHNIGKQSGGWTLTWQGTNNTNAEFPGATSIFTGIKHAVDSMGGSVELSPDGSWLKSPDVAVVVFGEGPYAEGQGDIDKLTYNSGDQSDLKLIKHLKKQGIPVVAIFLTGRPLWVNAEINWADAFVVAWLPGSEGDGIADVIISDQSGQPRYDFTGRLPFNWPAIEVNESKKSAPVSDYLLTVGQGLSYGDSEIVSAGLNEIPVNYGDQTARIIFDGRTRVPWTEFIGDGSDWAQELTDTSAVSSFGDLKVSVVDGKLQGDSRYARWSGDHWSQLYWQSEDRIDLTPLVEQSASLVMTYRVDKRPEGRVMLRMDCVWPCQGTQDVTELFKTVPDDQWVQSAISLECFKHAGADLSRINTPFLLFARGSFAITLLDIRIEPAEDNQTIDKTPCYYPG